MFFFWRGESNRHTPQKSNIDTKSCHFSRELYTLPKPSFLGIHVSFRGCSFIFIFFLFGRGLGVRLQRSLGTLTFVKLLINHWSITLSLHLYHFHTTESHTVWPSVWVEENSAPISRFVFWVGFCCGLKFQTQTGDSGNKVLAHHSRSTTTVTWGRFLKNDGQFVESPTLNR